MSRPSNVGYQPEGDTPVLIAVVGMTGSGKSSFINLASNSSKMTVSDDIDSCTDSVNASDPFDVDGRQVILFDTPGFDDSNMSETEVLGIITLELEKQHRTGQALHGIIYVQRISDQRVGGMAKANFGIFREMCGENSLRNVIIMTNMWSLVGSDSLGMARAKQLEESPKFLLPAIQKGAVVVHKKEDTREAALNVLRRIMTNHPLPLTIQIEVVDQNKPIDKTKAGLAVDEKLNKLAEQYEKQMQEQLAAAEAARERRDNETRQEQLEEAARVRDALNKLEADRRDQAEKYRQLQKELAASEERRRQAEDNSDTRGGC
ncbi:P-loop containing nucleoside triphosphate hydrolase protein [Ephemerocybe angulata]|uniref:P-loop containing nucleoside triphosphate hydrolase protein n=1 Tax=Ephemerocybe angulata TaxID=980116 RepID=A0A8H6HLA6_9AGAR|nr:P-loop containing nucleoside triphosphate hydrolase protein [Tulosesus angulatus]